MRKQNLTLLAVGVLVLLSVIFMGWAAMGRTPATPSPTEPAPTALLADATAQTSATPAAGGIVATGLFTMTLPDGWQYTTEQWAGAPPADMNHFAPLVIAWRGGPTFEQSPTRFNIVAMPRNDLTLDQYLVDVREQFSTTEGVADVNADIVTDLRDDGLPAVLVSYAMATAAGDFQGYQAVTLDGAANQIVIATLAHQADGVDAEQLFRTLVGSIYFAAPESARIAPLISFASEAAHKGA